jgi:hypothetical protein
VRGGGAAGTASVNDTGEFSGGKGGGGGVRGKRGGEGEGRKAGKEREVGGGEGYNMVREELAALRNQVYALRDQVFFLD